MEGKRTAKKKKMEGCSTCCQFTEAKGSCINRDGSRLSPSAILMKWVLAARCSNWKSYLPSRSCRFAICPCASLSNPVSNTRKAS